MGNVLFYVYERNNCHCQSKSLLVKLEQEGLTFGESTTIKNRSNNKKKKRVKNNYLKENELWVTLLRVKLIDK